jgi:hypothetical protein
MSSVCAQCIKGELLRCVKDDAVLILDDKAGLLFFSRIAPNR